MRILLAALLLVASCVGAEAHDYFNSAEVGCGTDANVLMCDDFEHDGLGNTPGTWYVNDGDHRTAIDKGWGGTIYANPITPPGAVICGAGAIFGNCSANGGLHSGSQGGVNMAGHGFAVGGVDEVYIRWYIKWVSGYQWSAEKNMNPTKAAGGIFWGNVHCNPGQGSRQSTCALQWANFDVSSASPGSVSSPLTLQSGRVYFVEAHMRLNTPGVSNGQMRLWTNDCGTAPASGTDCGAAPVLRHDVINVRWNNRVTTADKIEIVWLENWANNNDGVGSLGTGPYWDQLKVSRVGPIGFAGAIAPPTNFGLPGGAGQGTYNATGATTTLATPLPGPTLIGFVHRALLLVIILAALILWRRRNVHR